jgi:hypothetical protein
MKGILRPSKILKKKKGQPGRARESGTTVASPPSGPLSVEKYLLEQNSNGVG